MHEVTLEEKIDAKLEEIHGNGRFTCFAFFAIVLGLNATGFWFYILTYLTMPPHYKNCVYSEPPENPKKDCTYENICKDDSVITHYEIDWDNIYSLHNWVQRLDLTCAPGWKIGLLGSMVFVGWVATLSFVPRLSDKYNRKKIFLIGMYGDWLLFIVMFLTKSLDMMIVVMLMFGFMTTIRVNVGYVYMMELMPKRL